MNTVIPIVVALTVIVTIYSLYDLHRVSVLTVNQENLIDSQPRIINVTSDSSTKRKEEVKQVSLISPALSPSRGQCKVLKHTEVWGNVVKWGSSNILKSAEDCCNSCLDYKPSSPEDSTCNVWVFCDDKTKCKEKYGECWLKHLAHPTAAKPKFEGRDVMWTSGTSGIDVKTPAIPTIHTGRKYHTVTSASGSAVHWQMRIHYYHFQKVKAQCERQGVCDMGGFTRLLHSGEPDDLMDEIPTVVVDPLPKSMVDNNWYVVLNRPYAFVQWTQKVKIPEKYVLMSEPDHIFMVPLPNLMQGENPAAFPFFYIEPSKPSTAKIVEKFVGTSSLSELDKIAPIGNSPTIMSFTDMAKAMPMWMNISIAVFKDAEASKEWGWVQEMYGFTFALYKIGIQDVGLYLQLAAQPPWDDKMDLYPGQPFIILHYTYGMDYTRSGAFTPGKVGEWRFDKRSYHHLPPTRKFPSEPPVGMKNELVRRLMSSFTEAMNAIPCWDEYAATGKAVFDCEEAKTKPLLKDMKF